LSAVAPFAVVLGLAASGMLDRTLLVAAGPWITFGLPIGVVAGTAAGALLAPTVLAAPEVEWWFAAPAALVASPIGLVLGGVYGFVSAEGDPGARLIVAGIFIGFGIVLVPVAFAAGLVWVVLMRVIKGRA
jgi:hypothetical protein